MSVRLEAGDHVGVIQLLRAGVSRLDAEEAALTAASIFLPPAGEAPWMEVLDLALSLGVSCNLDDGQGSLLVRAARQGGLGRMSLLLDRGAILNSQSAKNRGGTPLMNAIEHGQAPAVALLLDRGANTEIQDGKGQTALFWAVRENRWDIIQRLLAHGASPFHADSNGDTLLHVAPLLALRGSTTSARVQSSEEACRMCSALVELGLDPAARNAHGETALEVAQHQGSEVGQCMARAQAQREAVAIAKTTPEAASIARRRSL